MPRLRDVVIDCHHPASLVRFWADVLDGYAIAPYDEEGLARLRELDLIDQLTDARAYGLSQLLDELRRPIVCARA